MPHACIKIGGGGGREDREREGISLCFAQKNQLKRIFQIMLVRITLMMAKGPRGL